MNCEQSERKLMLAGTNELSAREHSALQEHLADCERCRTCAEDLARLTTAAREALPDGEPGEKALIRILAAANERIPHVPSRAMRQPVLQLLGYAAVLAVVMGGWLMISRQDRTTRIEEVSDIIALIATSEEAEAFDVEDVGQDAQDLRALARELLIMEGLAVEDLMDPEWSTEDGSPSPTALQERSIAGPRPRICV